MESCEISISLILIMKPLAPRLLPVCPAGAVLVLWAAPPFTFLKPAFNCLMEKGPKSTNLPTANVLPYQEHLNSSFSYKEQIPRRESGGIFGLQVGESFAPIGEY